MNKKLSHIDEKGNVRMVNVSGKDDSTRIAIAKGEVVMKSETLDAVEAGELKKVTCIP